MKKLKIAHVTPYYYPSIGGVSSVAKYISEELASRGHLVNVITAHKDHTERPPLLAPKHEIINGVNVFRYNSILNIGHMSIMPSLIPHFIKHKYDVIHYHSYRHPLCDISALFGKLKSSVNLLHGHGPFFEKGEIKKSRETIYNLYDKFAARMVLKWSDKIIALNKFERERYIQLGISGSKIEIIPNAADSVSFYKYNIKDFVKKHKLEDRKAILSLGILNESKRQDLIVEALPLIISEVPEVILLIAGPDGGLLNLVEKKVEKLSVRNHYKYLGPLYNEEKHIAYEASSVFVLPSDKDAYPLVIAEAMAHHLPVVVTDARGPKDMVHDGIDGFILKKRDIDGIANSIIKLLKDKNLRVEMGRNARTNAEENHSAVRTVDQLEEIYYDILRKKKKITS